MHEDELWQEYDARGERIINGGLKKEGRTENFYGGVAIMLYRYREGQVEYLFQHRSKYVSHNPNFWDVSTAGHINYDEPAIEAVIRESKEEIGAEIDQDKLEFAGGYRTGDCYTRVYFYDWTDRSSDFHFDDKEVSEVKWVPFNNLVDFWPKLKKKVQDDAIFQTMLLKWNKMIQEKYENH